jgi:hypothetical protein
MNFGGTCLAALIGTETKTDVLFQPSNLTRKSTGSSPLMNGF